MPIFSATLAEVAPLKTLQRAFTVVARFAMFLDGGPSRVRTTDLDGGE